MSEMIQYKCPACGGALEFNSRVQKMKCPYCDTEFDVAALREHEKGVEEASRGGSAQWDQQPGSAWRDGETGQMAVYVCQSCGGEIIADRNRGAMSCPWCNNPVVMKGQFSGALRPDYVIPFQLDKEQAKAQFSRHLMGKRLLPKVFRTQNHIDEIRGIYVPFWLFDAEARGEARYRATRIHTWADRNFNYTETSYFSVERAGTMHFVNVPADASSKMADQLMESIEPYDFSQAVDFETAYLAGYLADKYDVTADESLQRISRRVEKSVKQALDQTVSGYDSVEANGGHVDISHGRAQYALYPVWILNTTWKKQHFLFAMNGQTGKFVGDLPLDRAAYDRWLIGLTAGFGVAVYLIHLLVDFL